MQPPIFDVAFHGIGAHFSPNATITLHWAARLSQFNAIQALTSRLACDSKLKWSGDTSFHALSTF